VRERERKEIGSWGEELAVREGRRTDGCVRLIERGPIQKYVFAETERGRRREIRIDETWH